MESIPTFITDDGRRLCLGRTETSPKDLARRLFARDFVTTEAGLVLPVKDAIDYHAVAMSNCANNGLTDPLSNDAVGSCAWAAPGHMIQLATSCESWKRADAVTATEVRREYFTYTGGRDVGSNLGDVLKVWKQKGICGSKIEAFLAIKPADEDMIRWCLDYLGPLYLGINLPISWWQSQKYWEANAGRIKGGHAVVLSGYDTTGVIYETWGVKTPGSWAGLHQYCDEIYAVIQDPWTAGGTKPCPAGLDIVAIRKQVELVAAA